MRQNFRLKYLLSETKNSWAVHPSIIRKGNEVARFSVRVNHEMPEEVLPYIKYFRVSLILEKVVSIRQALKLKDVPNGGFLIDYAKKGSQAEEDCLKEGDVFTHVDGKPVKNAQEAWKIIYAIKSSRVYFYRRGITTISVTIGE